MAGVLIRTGDEVTDRHGGRQRGEDSHLQSKVRGLGGTRPAGTLIADFGPLES